jgi:O-acetyl-ADP-ribose deacetylase (regulator of RNase III)
MAVQVNNTMVEVVRGSVVEQKVDAIVNAANTGMRGGGGIDGVIHRKAGKGLMEELIRVAPHGAKTGQVVVTGAHNLPHKHILHTPGPRWRDGAHGEPDLLAQSYRNCIDSASSLGLESLAYCSIATGVYRFPIDRAAEIAVRTVLDFLNSHPDTSLRRAVFAMYGETEFDVFTAALAGAAEGASE